MRFATDVEVIAHRGASGHAPEHTWAAYDLALAQGADALELDVRMTGDRQLVIRHDPGPVPPGTLRLHEVFARYGRRTRYLVELKDPRPWLPRLVRETIQEHDVADRVVVQSFDRPWLKRMGDLPVQALFTPWTPRRRILRAIEGGAFAGVGVWHRSVDKDLVAAAHGRGLAVRAWTVNAPPDMTRLVAAGVDGLITDYPDRVRSQLDAPAALAA